MKSKQALRKRASVWVCSPDVVGLLNACSVPLVCFAGQYMEGCRHLVEKLGREFLCLLFYVLLCACVQPIQKSLYTILITKWFGMRQHPKPPSCVLCNGFYPKPFRFGYRLIAKWFGMRQHPKPPSCVLCNGFYPKPFRFGYRLIAKWFGMRQHPKPPIRPHVMVFIPNHFGLGIFAERQMILRRRWL